MFTAFLTEHWISLLFGLLSTAIVAYCKYLNKKFKEYKTLIEEKNEEEIAELIQKDTAPLKTRIETLESKMNAIKESYRYRLIALCELYLDRGYLTPKEYSAISELWKVYHSLGGNSQGEDYYHKVEHLPVHDNH